MCERSGDEDLPERNLPDVQGLWRGYVGYDLHRNGNSRHGPHVLQWHLYESNNWPCHLRLQLTPYWSRLAGETPVLSFALRADKVENLLASDGHR